MKLRQYINELSLKSGTTIKIKQGKDFVDATITTTDDETFEFTIDKGNWLYYNTDIREWEIVFTDSTGSLKTIKKSPKIALQLFAAIEQITTNFIKKYKPEAIRFSGMGSSKIKLYNLLAKRIEKSGYINFEGDSTSTSWQLVRKDIAKEIQKGH